MVKNTDQDKVLKYIELVEIIRNSKDKEKQDLAFSEIVQMMQQNLKKFTYNFTIPGYDKGDIYQESLFALKYKAIKDYDSSRSDIKDISPFDKFAMICIRRHLSTRLKASYQYKNKVLNSSISLNQDRNTNSDNDLYLADILVDTNSAVNIISDMNQKEYQKILFNKLFSKLSVFEKKVFMLYAQKMSYSEMSEKLFDILDEEEKEKILLKHARDRVKYILKSVSKKNEDKKQHFLNKISKGVSIDKLSSEELKTYSEKEKKEIIIEKTIKSIDNGLSRIKAKAKETFEKHG